MHMGGTLIASKEKQAGAHAEAAALALKQGTESRGAHAGCWLRRCIPVQLVQYCNLQERQGAHAQAAVLALLRRVFWHRCIQVPQGARGCTHRLLLASMHATCTTMSFTLSSTRRARVRTRRLPIWRQCMQVPQGARGRTHRLPLASVHATNLLRRCHFHCGDPYIVVHKRRMGAYAQTAICAYNLCCVVTSQGEHGCRSGVNASKDSRGRTQQPASVHETCAAL